MWLWFFMERWSYCLTHMDRSVSSPKQLPLYNCSSGKPDLHGGQLNLPWNSGENITFKEIQGAVTRLHALTWGGSSDTSLVSLCINSVACGLQARTRRRINHPTLWLKLRYHTTRSAAHLQKKKRQTTNDTILGQLIPMMSLLDLKCFHCHQPVLVSIAHGSIIPFAQLSRRMTLPKDHGKEK